MLGTLTHKRLEGRSKKLSTWWHAPPAQHVQAATSQIFTHAGQNLAPYPHTFSALCTITPYHIEHEALLSASKSNQGGASVWKNIEIMRLVRQTGQVEILVSSQGVTISMVLPARAATHAAASTQRSRQESGLAQQSCESSD